jgi:hypothetical protein
MMNCVHSLWTGTPMFKVRRGPLLVHALSLCLAAEWFPAVELVTDDRGTFLAEALGFRYTSIINALQAPPKVAHVWARGKFEAILTQSGPFLHIDTDVLLIKPLCPKLLRSRAVAQSLDFPDYYRGNDMVNARQIAGLPPHHPAYNCGVMGGTDLHFWHEYARKSLALVDRFEGCSINGTTTSMVCEQYHLGVFAREAGVRVDTVCEVHPTYEEIERTGYVHLQGPAKTDPGWIVKVEDRMRRDFPEAYIRFCKGWDALEKRLPRYAPSNSCLTATL